MTKLEHFGRLSTVIDGHWLLALRMIALCCLLLMVHPSHKLVLLASADNVHAVAAVAAAAATTAPTSPRPLPFATLTFPSPKNNADASRWIGDNEGRLADHHRHNERIATQHRPYLASSIIKERVPGGWNTFVAHMFVAADPLHHFSVLPPMRGCGYLDTPADTADAMYGGFDDDDGGGGCDVATNGGFFIPGNDPDDGTHQCIGPIVSDGNTFHDEYRNNVLFGIESTPPVAASNGRGLHNAPNETVSYFIGFMNESEFRKRRWVQLISGLGWLVHEGKPFLQQSKAFDDFSIQRSGSAETFASLRAPRLALGITQDGSLMIVAFDGSEPDWEGVTLDDVAKTMVALGAIEAINLDGGGSVSVYVKDELVNIPSDVCPNASKSSFPKFRCSRRVSSVLCLHKYRNTPRWSQTATRPMRSASLRPSHTTMSVSTSPPGNGDRHGHHRTGLADWYLWGEHADPWTVTLGLAKILLPLLLLSLVTVYVVRRCREWRALFQHRHTLLSSNNRHQHAASSSAASSPSFGTRRQSMMLHEPWSFHGFCQLVAFIVFRKDPTKLPPSPCDPTTVTPDEGSTVTFGDVVYDDNSDDDDDAAADELSGADEEMCEE